MDFNQAIVFHSLEKVQCYFELNIYRIYDCRREQNFFRLTEFWLKIDTCVLRHYLESVSLPSGCFTSLFSSISYHQHVITWNFTTTNKWTSSNEHQSSFCSTGIYHHRFDVISKRVLLEHSPWHKWVPCHSSHNFISSQLIDISQYFPPFLSALCPLGAMWSITRGHTLLRRTSHLYRETVSGDLCGNLNYV